MANMGFEPGSDQAIETNIGVGLGVSLPIAIYGSYLWAGGALGVAFWPAALVVGGLTAAGFALGYFGLGPALGAPLDQGASPVDTGTQSTPDIYSSGDFGIGGGDSNLGAQPDVPTNMDLSTNPDFGIGGGDSNLVMPSDVPAANMDLSTNPDFGIGGGDSNYQLDLGTPSDIPSANTDLSTNPDFGIGGGDSNYQLDLGTPSDIPPANMDLSTNPDFGIGGGANTAGAGNESQPAFTDPGTSTPTNDGSGASDFQASTNDGSNSSYPTNVGSYPTNVGSYPTNVGSYPTNVNTNDGSNSSYPTNAGSYPGSYPGSFGGGGYGGGGYGGYGGYGGGGYGGGGYYPIVLDLTGKGINIRQLSSSNTFFDMTGDGRQNLTAWAGPGNGVLFYDPTGTGQLTQANQIIFTDWDPTAHSDMQALLDVFDTNHDGALSQHVTRRDTGGRNDQTRRGHDLAVLEYLCASAFGSHRSGLPLAARSCRKKILRQVTQMGGGGADIGGYEHPGKAQM
jgi:hypothetical protein